MFNLKFTELLESHKFAYSFNNKCKLSLDFVLDYLKILNKIWLTTEKIHNKSILLLYIIVSWTGY